MMDTAERLSRHLEHEGWCGRLASSSHLRDLQEEILGSHDHGLFDRDNSDFSIVARSTWARLLKKIFAIDILICTCCSRMQIFSFITDARVVDLILRHRQTERCKPQDPFERRAPPRLAAPSLPVRGSRWISSFTTPLYPRAPG